MEFLEQAIAWLGGLGGLGYLGWRSPWSSRRPKQQRTCRILQLPHELILNISDSLSPASRVLLSQTCRPLQGILCASAAHLSYEQYLEYLTGLAHDRCDQWVCEVCPALHRTDERDIPSCHWILPCPRYKSQWQEMAYGSSHRLDRRQHRIDHRHVQLALKCTRLRQYPLYREKLLEPYNQTNWRGEYFPSDPLSTTQIHYRVLSKIVTRTERRFLIMSQWEYTKCDREFTLASESMGHLMICPHLARPLRGRYHTDTELAITIRKAFNHRPSEIKGACSRCRTDFSVEVSADLETAKLCVWQDLGPEGSPMDASWNSQVHRHSIHQSRPCGIYCRTEHTTMYHEPYSVRQLFYWDTEEERLARWRARQPPCRTDTS